VCEQCGAGLQARPDPLIGRTVGGAYLLQELIGVGGMGRVYRAEQNMLGRTVAVKVIHPHLLGDDQTLARFYNEARAASRLNHPASVSIIDFGRTEDSNLYLVMEFLDGRDLAQILAEEGPLPFLRICRIMRHILSALGEAHALGVVHRDLKPENIILRRVRRGAEQVKVVDFGLAHIVGSGGTSITTPGLVCGTPDYMSPEQGKGETVDGRGDLYSLGVMLFEMLTDRLPFEDDTPTKVVFRHIHDPVPDPRQLAPYRAIPEDLADVALKALSKKREDRFQTADEMYEAIHAIELDLERQGKGSFTECPACRSKNPRDMRFCGECGARLTERFSLPPGLRTGAPPPRATLLPGSDAPLMGRRVELERLGELHAATRNGPVWVHAQGEPGVGKTRFLLEAARRFDEAGDRVVDVAAHPSGEPVPYWAARQLLLGLLEVDEAKLGELATQAVVGDPLARAGIGEVLSPKGMPGAPGMGLASAVAMALVAALRVAVGRSTSGAVALLVDDLDRADSLSRTALAEMVERLGPEDHVLLLTSSRRRAARQVPEDVDRIVLEGLDPVDGLALITGAPPLDDHELRIEANTPTRLYTPLYLRTLRALGFLSLDPSEEGFPTRLSDAILRRLERLGMEARRLLQGIAVLGEVVPRTSIEALLGKEGLGGLPELLKENLIEPAPEGALRVDHPFLRELVEGSIPAEARKELHARALDVALGVDAPLEVRAHHAFRAGEPMSALLLLERMGDAALERGDAETAVLGYRRGLELARRELLMAGDTTLDRAIVTFSRKLGRAMDRAGDHATADGVLREALELAGPVSRERPKMLLVLGQVARGRGRERDARRFFSQALELATRHGDDGVAAKAHLALGRLRFEAGEAEEALRFLTKAMELADGENADVQLDATLLASEALRVLTREPEAFLMLEQARSLAEARGPSAALARVLARTGEVLEKLGQREEASTSFREAGRLAAEVGDAQGAREWHRLGRLSSARRAG
jgi:serine/threonine protein kinase/tetratricopeptide (TPR) repeat protein